MVYNSRAIIAKVSSVFSPSLQSLVLGLGLLLSLFAVGQAANPNGDLRIEVITAYNLIVDSNVESPSTYAPEAGTIGAKFCNDGSNALTDVIAYVGDFNTATPANSTPGIYPSRTHSGLSGLFALSHEGGSAGTADATRFIGTIPAGECVVQYWLISYPRLDDNGQTVTGGIKPDDDLWLNYDIWVKANDGGAPLLADQTRKLTLRNEISAAANKIWPNGDNKVPDLYKNAINEFLGWDAVTNTGEEEVFPGDTLVVKGIWYDLGNVGQGFDNDGDLLPDQNAWLQPVGDPSLLDGGCFRLVHTFGLVIVKLKSGGELLLPFEDQLYFEHIPDNTGAVGLVFYEYAALDGACTGTLSPYQEVASGWDNEKFNGDYGHATPPITSLYPSVELNKTVNQSVIGPGLPATLDYTLQITNTGPKTVGNLAYGIPLVIQEAIPVNTTYVVGSADDNVNIHGGAIATVIRYSTNGGATWSETEPASGVTHIQWWLQAGLPSGATGSVTFQVIVPNSYPQVTVPNLAALSFGSSPPFTSDDAITLILGNNHLGDTVFADNGSGTLFANGSFDGGESGLANVTVTLYVDQNQNGSVEPGDFLWGTTTTNGSGVYTFSNLPDGNYLVAVNQDDPDLPTGWTNTTAPVRAIALDANGATPNPVSDLSADFGFAPALVLDKTLQGSSPIYEGDHVNYSIDLTNRLPGNGTAVGGACTYLVWATAEDSRTSSLPANSQRFQDSANAFNLAGPDGLYAFSPFSNARDQDAGTGFSLGTPVGSIVSVEALFSIYVSGQLNNDRADALLFFNNIEISTTAFTSAQLSAFGNTPAAQGLLTWDVSAAKSWAWSDFAGDLDLEFDAVKTVSADGPIIYLDAIGFRLTSDQNCLVLSDNTITTLPLTDTYNAAQLQFVAANPPVDSSVPAGTLSWSNLGPLFPGQTKSISVTFLALQPTQNPETVHNVVTNGQSYWGNGRPANRATVTETVTLSATGSLSGVVWSDLNNNGWLATSGYEASDGRIPNVRVTLYACKSGNGDLVIGAPTNKDCVGSGGTWQIHATQFTNASGGYHFTGLRDGYYYVAVDQSTIPGADVQKGDPNEQGAICSTCDNQSNLTTDKFAPATFLGMISNANDVINVNFGYTVPAALFGKVWQDSDGDGVKDSGETGIFNVTVTLYASDCSTQLQATTTDANGNYTFGDLADSTIYCLKTSLGTLPTGGTWSETAESDSSINNQIVVTAQGGVISGSHDFGFHHSGSSTIGDTLFYDWDGDGVQDGSDEGIAAINVSLYHDADGNGQVGASDPLVAISVTNSSGYYLFSALPAGNYLVVVDRADAQFPAAVVQTGDPDEGSTCAVCDDRSTVSVDGNNQALNEDFGYQPSGVGLIGDTVWYDQNGDGSQAGLSETGLPSVTVQLWADLNGDGTYHLILSDTTDSLGHYHFANLPDGNYRVMVNPQDPAIPQDAFGNPYAPSTPTTFSATLSNALVTQLNGSPCTNCNLKADFGFTTLGSIGDTVFWDANGDAELDWHEQGIGGVLVTLTNASTQTLQINGVPYAPGATISTTLTSVGTNGNPLGFYLFAGLPPGIYTVQVDSSGPINSALQTSDPNRDGVACVDNTYPALPACDHQTTVQIAPGTSFMGADFGYQSPGAFGDFVWFDQDGDGTQDAGEPGLAGIVVTATTGANVTVAGVNYPTGTTLTTTTDYDGYYSFATLLSIGKDATWTVDVGTPTNRSATYDPDGTPNASSSVTIDTTGAVVMVGGTNCNNCALTVDFGFTLAGPYTLSGSLCLETTASSDGYCGHPSDSPVTSYTLYLYNAAGLYLGSTTTDANGGYTFTNLLDDTYFVAVGTTLPPLDAVSLTTMVGDTPATNISQTAVSVYQTVPLNDESQVGVDFAFLANFAYDFGDLPQSYNTTLEGSPSGPRHTLPARSTLYLGAISPDSESNGVASADASADGLDEDGVLPVTLLGWVDGPNGGSIQVEIEGNGWLVGWVDFNDDGDFTDVGEMIVNQAVSAGSSNLTFAIPAGTITGTNDHFYSRFRLFAQAPLFPFFAYVGATASGEVEDYYWSFVQVSPSLIAGHVYADLDGDGSFDPGEPGLPGVLITLSDGVTTTTDSNGSYTFTVSAGTYSVSESTPAGYYSTAASPGTVGSSVVNQDLISVTLLSGEKSMDNDFLDAQFGSIGNLVWEDRDFDGNQDIGESPIAGVTVTLGSADGTVQTTTDSSGLYTFTNVLSGTYYLTFSLPTGYSFTPVFSSDTTDQGGTQNDSNANPSSGATGAVSIIAGQNNQTVDAGLIPPADLAVVKDATTDTYVEGTSASATYIFTVTNFGPADVVNILVSDNAPSNVLFDSWQCAIGNVGNGSVVNGCATLSGTGNINTTVTLRANASAVFMVSATISNTAQGALVNTAAVSLPITVQQDPAIDRPNQDSATIMSLEPTATATATPTATATEPEVPPTATATATATPTSTATDPEVPSTATATATATPTSTATDSEVPTATATATATPTSTATNPSVPPSVTPTATATSTPINPSAQPSLGNLVWHDANNNGTVDSGEDGIDGVVLQLFAAGQDPVTRQSIMNVTTSNGGQYQFANLEPGDYFVYLPNPPAQYNVSSSSTDEADNQQDNDDNGKQSAAGAPIRSPVIHLTSQNDQTLDFGFFASVAIGDRVWYDEGVYGQYEPTFGEKGVAGVVVALFNADNSAAQGLDGLPVPNQTTGSDGRYLFQNLAPGSYYVEFALNTLPTGYLPTIRKAANVAADFDSDANPTTGQTAATLFLASGTQDLSVDMGIFLPAKLGGTVWDDGNQKSADGIKATNEPPIAGVVVILTDKNGVEVGRVTTDAAGNFLFTNLLPGDYRLAFVAPPNAAYTTYVPSTGEINSDADPLTGRTTLITLQPGVNDLSWGAGFILSPTALEERDEPTESRKVFLPLVSR